jgi:hypothetical protein
MAGKNTAAFAIFPSRAAAEAAVNELTVAGFSSQDISVLMADKSGTKDFATEKNTKAPEGTATGAGVGGGIGGTLGLLAGIGALAIPGVGPLIAAGPIMATLAGVGVGGAIGGIVGALVGMGIPEYEAKRYEGRVKEGGILASVHCDSSEEVSRAKDILKRAGGEDVASAGEKSISSHTVEKSVGSHLGEESVHSPDTIDAYRDREPRVESSQNPDTINAYRAKEPRSAYPEGAATEDEILDGETRNTRTRSAV